MEPDKQLLEAWDNGVALGNAWLVFADAENRKRFFKARREGSPSSIRISLEIDLVARLSDGELQAIGIEGGSDPRPAFVPRYFFSKTAKINLDDNTVEAFGKKFHEVKVQGPREEADDEQPTNGGFVDQRLISVDWKPVGETLPSEQEPPDEPPIQGERELTDEMLPGKPTPEKLETALSPPRGRGRPSKELEIERAIDILLARGVGLAKLPRPKAMTEIRKCAASELNSDINIGFSDPVLERFLIKRFGPRR